MKLVLNNLILTQRRCFLCFSMLISAAVHIKVRDHMTLFQDDKQMVFLVVPPMDSQISSLINSRHDADCIFSQASDWISLIVASCDWFITNDVILNDKHYFVFSISSFFIYNFGFKFFSILDQVPIFLSPSTSFYSRHLNNIFYSRHSIHT